MVEASRKRQRGSVAARTGVVFGLSAGACTALGAALAHAGALSAFAGFRFFLLGIPLGVVGLVASNIALMAARRALRSGNATASMTMLRGRAWTGLGLSLATLGLVLALSLPTAGYPLINDITTDLDDPPRFVKAPTLKANRGRDMSYPGAAVAAEQRRGYPDLGPLFVAVEPAVVFEKVRRALDRLPGTEVTEAVAEEGRIEARAISRVFRFVDDLIVRVRQEGHGTRVDVRSKSRDGKGDLGANAARIEALFAAMR